MAEFTRVHGDARPVVNLDSKEGFKNTDNTFSDSTGIPINLAGPKLDFFSITLNYSNSPDGQMGTGGAIEAVIKTVQQLATVHMYQVDDLTPGSSAQLSLAVYPTAAWTAGDLEDQIQALGTVNGYNMSSSDVEGHGFRLWFDNP
jgi:hypothetical protein